MRMLVFGRVDLIPENAVVAAAIIQNNSWQDKIKKHEKPVDLDVLYIALSRKSPAVQILPQINAAIKTIRENGLIKSIGKEIGVPSFP
jgi:ABC-type amino acid transport substrate-binding protein